MDTTSATDVAKELSEVIEACIVRHLTDNSTANAKLSLRLAQEVSTSVEDRLKKHTAREISQLVTIVNSGSAELHEFRTVLNNIIVTKGDTDELTLMNLLNTSTMENVREIHANSIRIEDMRTSLANFSTRLYDLERRVTSVEENTMRRESIVGLMREVLAAGCSAMQTRLNDYEEENNNV